MNQKSELPGKPTPLRYREGAERGFFTKPEIIEKYGADVVERAREIIADFSARQAGIG